MNCRECEEQIVEALYGELTGEAHLCTESPAERQHVHSPQRSNEVASLHQT